MDYGVHRFSCACFGEDVGIASTPKPEESAQVRVILMNGETYHVPVTRVTTLLTILNYIGIDPELFNPATINSYIFINMEETAMPNLDKNMLYYNNWNIERGYIPSLYIKHRDEVINEH
jgi:hypothetical protein